MTDTHNQSDVASEVSTTDLPAELVAEVMIYSNDTTTNDNKIQNYITHQQIRTLQQWFIEIGVQTKWSDVKKEQYPPSMEGVL